MTDLRDFSATALDIKINLVYTCVCRLPRPMIDASGGIGSGPSQASFAVAPWIELIPQRKTNAGTGLSPVKSRKSRDEFVLLKGDAAGQNDPASMSRIQPHHPPPRHQRQMGQHPLAQKQCSTHAHLECGNQVGRRGRGERNHQVGRRGRGERDHIPKCPRLSPFQRVGVRAGGCGERGS